MTIVEEMTLVFSGLATIAAVIGALGLIWAAVTFNFNTWLKAQEIYMDKEFYAAREAVFSLWDQYKGGSKNLETEPPVFTDTAGVRLVCQRMDELARLVPYISKRKIVKVWGFQMGKSWLLSQDFVNKERNRDNPNNDGFKKWDAFERLAEKAATKHKLRQLLTAP